VSRSSGRDKAYELDVLGNSRVAAAPFTDRFDLHRLQAAAGAGQRVFVVAGESFGSCSAVRDVCSVG
jgi:hypothetical protein